MSITLEFNPDDLDLGELVELEEITGVPVGAIDMAQPSAKALLAMIFLIERRKDPAFTLDDAKAIKVTAIDTGNSGNPPAALTPLEQPPVQRSARRTQPVRTSSP